MNLADLLVLAQMASPTPEGAGPEPSLLNTIIPFGFMIVIFYFLLIRPQQKRQKEHQALVETVKTGDRIITNSGIHGIIANVKEKTIVVKVADNVKIEFDRAAVATVERAPEAALETK